MRMMKLVNPETIVWIIRRDAITVNERSIADIFKIQLVNLLGIHVWGAGQHLDFDWG